MKFAEFESFKMAYEEVGSGIPLLLIHGYPLNRHMWQPQLDELGKDARVIAPDLRGHGDSTPTEGIYTMDLLAEDCAKLLDHLRIREKIVLCGLSMGGYISFAFARNYPERLAGLILTATRAAPDTEEHKLNRQRSLALAKEQGLEPIIEAMLPRVLSPTTLQNRPDLVQTVRKIMQRTSLQAILGDLQGMMERADSRPFLKQITVPTLILHGKEDPLIPVEEAKAMQESIPNCRLVLLDRAGHLPNLEASEQFNQAIREFIQTL
ncbi:MAG: alpha/beta fold hydrolase [Anaerolineales bacterium]|nr:alpha/beta fold hydrolase [Anaerolineales bacterium]MCS7248554.1 alpha/beta fold hydrolase [Anaerolineales bacterium]MDW8162367.1 alpha/beta fold hydrolase [Anaerolineales bacterium]MDW8447547.1 alpha/beta fold hydrolase [Anaerolineales bacterium]